MTRKSIVTFIVLLLSATLVCAQAAVLPPNPANIELVDVATGFSRPLYLTHAGDGSGRLFVVEQGGVISIIDGEQRLSNPFLDISEKVSQDALGMGYSERGLLGLAFHPEYEENGRFYINYTDRNGNTVVAQYNVSSMDPNMADASSEVVLLTQEQPFPNHNGGHMAFGPDGYLYIALGDGGSAGDPLNAGQDTTTWLGKILRIDVSEDGVYTIPEDNPVNNGHPEFLPEIWAYGLRNPWRFSFDRETGDLYIADVGQNLWEEVNFQPADSPGGENYGWRYYEADQVYDDSITQPENAVMPIASYNHNEGISVTGGYVYRGEAIPEMQGAYFFGDFGRGTIWSSYRDESGAWQTDIFMRSNRTISSFGEDEQGELYLVDYAGRVMRFAPKAQ